jgi:hypothetical protein
MSLFWIPYGQGSGTTVDIPINENTNPINRYHATTFLCLSLTPEPRFRLVTVLLVSVLSRLRFVDGIVRVVAKRPLSQKLKWHKHDEFKDQ